VTVTGEVVAAEDEFVLSKGVALLPENSANCAAIKPLVIAAIVGAASAPAAIL
jgi:hypothetical protein